MARSLRCVGLLLLAFPLAAAAAPQDAPAPRDPPSSTPAPDRRSVGRLPPNIERLMPLSSCSPGGGIMLQGKNFGSSPGRLRLIGHFPNGSLDLEQLEWGSGAIGGQVPMVEGVLDQTVTIQVVTRDGKFSNGIRCDFEATRVEVALAGQDYFRGYCHFGDNHWSGNDFYEADDHYRAGNWKGSTVICYHKSDKPTTHGDNEGTDVWEIRTLENGWKLTRMPFGDNNGGSGEILSLTGFRPEATTAEIRVHWRMGHDAVVHYSFLLFAEGPAGVPMRGPFEPPGRPAEQLGDWQPHAPKGHVPLTIVSPASSISYGATSFDLAITADAPDPGWTIQLEWAHLAPPKDRSLGRESWNVGKPASAPKAVAWSALPLTLATSQFEGQSYAVRAKVMGEGDDTWTPWKRFRVSDPVKLQAKPSAGEPKLQPAPGRRLGAMPKAAPERRSVGPKAGLHALAQPRLVLDAGAARPSPEPTTKDRFGVKGLRVRNAGTADAALGHLPLKVDCEPLDGGSCRVHGKARVPAVPAGQTRPLSLDDVFQANASGRYRIRVSLEAPGAKSENTWTREVSVTGEPRLKRIPGRPPPPR